MANSINFNKKTFFIVSGASRGIGQMMAIEFSKLFSPDSVCVLLARNLNGLQETEKLINQANPLIKVKNIAIDLTELTTKELDTIFYESLLTTSIDISSNNNCVPSNQFELAFIIHNVGTIGDITKSAKEFSSLNDWRSYFDGNFFSVANLNSKFLKVFENIGKKLIINITSKCSSVPFNSFTLYCTSRAAREMYFKVLASEEETAAASVDGGGGGGGGGGGIVVLNYSPGVVDTEMTIDVQDRSVNSDLREYFKGLRDSDKMIKPIETAQKLHRILLAGKFKSGDYVDYYTEESDD